MKVRKGPIAKRSEVSATALSLMIVGSYAAPFILITAIVAGLFAAIMSQ